MAEPSSSQTETTTKPQLIYRCKKCRRIIASEENIVSHECGKGQSSFKWKKRSSEPWEMEKQPADCTSIFVEPMKWMQAGTRKISLIYVLLVTKQFFKLHTNTGYGLAWKYKKVMWRRNFSVWVVMLVWVTSTGLVCSAAVEPG
ncbi:inactive dual specificity protein phosphatase [Spatholobus suberectus]|nr:inactive dual specificity protein phosphatase [Spatholobus suberectus]